MATKQALTMTIQLSNILVIFLKAPYSKQIEFFNQKKAFNAKDRFRKHFVI